jgi:hypothetical protein
MALRKIRAHRPNNWPVDSPNKTTAPEPIASRENVIRTSVRTLNVVVSFFGSAVPRRMSRLRPAGSHGIGIFSWLSGFEECEHDLACFPLEIREMLHRTKERLQ